MTIQPELAEDLYRFIWKIIGKSDCRLIRIGGIQNHLHLLIDLNPTVALSELVRNIKSVSSGWMRSDPRFTLFRGWGSEYYANTISPEHQNAVIEYIKNQQTHHWGHNFDMEIKEMCRFANISFDDRNMR